MDEKVVFQALVTARLLWQFDGCLFLGLGYFANIFTLKNSILVKTVMKEGKYMLQSIIS